MEITTADIVKTIRQYVNIEEGDLFGVHAAAEEVQALYGWRPIEDAPKDEMIDLLSNSAIRFTNCFWDKEKCQWISKIRYMDYENIPRTVYNVVVNPTNYMLIPKIK